MKSLKTTSSLIATALLLCTSIALITSPQSAFADTNTPATETEFAFPFSYSNTELQSSEAAGKLLTRLEHRIKRHCASPGKVNIADRKLAARCVDNTLQQAVVKLGSSTLAEVYSHRSDG